MLSDLPKQTGVICRCSNTATSPDWLAAAATELCLRVESAVHQHLHVRNPDSCRPHICAGISLCVLFFLFYRNSYMLATDKQQLCLETPVENVKRGVWPCSSVQPRHITRMIEFTGLRFFYNHIPVTNQVQKLHEQKLFYRCSTVLNVCLKCKLITAVIKEKKQKKTKTKQEPMCSCGVLLLCVITVSILPARRRGGQRHFNGSATFQLSTSDFVVGLVTLRCHSTNDEPPALLGPALVVLPFAKSCVNRLFWSWRRNAA